jgi:serine/threonine protein phosphatase PrpC
MLSGIRSFTGWAQPVPPSSCEAAKSISRTSATVAFTWCVGPVFHILTAALGVGEGSLADSGGQELNLENGDALVLCTDGLWSLVSEPELETVIKSNRPSESCAAVVTMALERGGPDNITVQVVRLGP